MISKYVLKIRNIIKGADFKPQVFDIFLVLSTR